jgi:hypothetical protein
MTIKAEQVPDELLSEDGMKDFIDERDMLKSKYGKVVGFRILGTIQDTRDPNF